MIVEDWRSVELQPEDTLALVGCGKSKKDKPVRASDMYTSTYFRSKWSAANVVGAPKVLSAKHGLLEPDEVIEPYDLNMRQLDDSERDAWGSKVMTAMPGDVGQVWIFSGKDYIEPIVDEAQRIAKVVVLPFANTGSIGEQQSVCNQIKMEHRGANSLI